MATLLWQRDIASSVGSAKDSLSSWDGCMSKAYCKWPVIIGIIVGSVIILSLLWCCARCLCCGAECCCGCLSCCNACCPSPRSKKDHGYHHAGGTPFHQQYHSPAYPPQYASGGMGYRSANVPQTARFDASKGGKVHEDSLPAMPSWDHAASRQELVEEEVEMEKLNEHRPTSVEREAGTLPKVELPVAESPPGGSRQDLPQGGEMGGMAASPYNNNYQRSQQTFGSSPYGYQNGNNNYQQSQQTFASAPTYGSQNGNNNYQQSQQTFASAPTYGSQNGNTNWQHSQQTFASAPYASQNRMSPPQQQSVSPTTPGATQRFYGPSIQQYGNQQPTLRNGGGYEPSIPPSYHTRPPSDMGSPVSPQGQQAPAYPGQQTYQAYAATPNRKPVQGSWRDV